MKSPCAILPLILASVLVGMATLADGPNQAQTNAEIQDKLKLLEEKIESIRTQDKARGLLWADAEIFHKGVIWTLRYDKDFSEADTALIKKSIDRGMERLNALESGRTYWPAKKGRLVRGYQSQVDGSIQPYCLVIQKSYDPEKPIRLDVGLHGTTPPVRLTEPRVHPAFDAGDEVKP